MGFPGGSVQYGYDLSTSNLIGADGTPILSTRYTRDALGRIETRMEVFGGQTTEHAYRYDETGRLTEVLEDGVVVEAYTWDANGNRTSVTTSGGVTTATYDAQDRPRLSTESSMTPGDPMYLSRACSTNWAPLGSICEEPDHW